MKFRSLCATSLVAVTVLTLAGSVVADATATELASNGKVTVTEGGITPPPDGSGVIDPENPDKELPKDPDEGTVTPNPNSGALIVTNVSDLEFTDIQTSNLEQTVYAKSLKYTIDGKAETRGGLVQFGDVRTSAHGYSVQAELTTQFTNSGSATLNGATINFNNGILAQEGGSMGTVPGGFVGNTATPLAYQGGPQTFVTATGNQGKGLWIIEFGQSSTYAKTPAAGTAAAGSDASSVQLKVPAATAGSMAEGDYTAVVTWSIVAA